MSKLRDEILPGIRSLPFRAHVIFYAIEPARIVIERVLHGSMDLEQHFPNNTQQ